MPQYDWETSVYGIVKEEIPKGCFEPLGKEVVLTHLFVDANLYHYLTTSRAVTGILHLVNQTPIEWYTKWQPTVDTTTYGSEFMAARTATEQIMDLRLTLHYLGVPIYGVTYLFGAHKTVVDSSFVPHLRLHKRRQMLSYHCIQEAKAATLLYFISSVRHGGSNRFGTY